MKNSDISKRKGQKIHTKIKKINKLKRWKKSGFELNKMVLAMGDFYMWFALVQMGDLSNFNIVHICCDGGQLRWWWNGWNVEITWPPAQWNCTSNKKCRRKCAKNYNLQATSLKGCTQSMRCTTTRQYKIRTLRQYIYMTQSEQKWNTEHIPAKKTVANASEAHIPHFKWLGIIWESVECTAFTLATFAANTVRSSGKISFVGRIAFKPNAPCSNSIGKCDWLRIKFKFGKK